MIINIEVRDTNTVPLTAQMLYDILQGISPRECEIIVTLPVDGSYIDDNMNAYRTE